MIKTSLLFALLVTFSYAYSCDCICADGTHFELPNVNGGSVCSTSALKASNCPNSPIASTHCARNALEIMRNVFAASSVAGSILNVLVTTLLKKMGSNPLGKMVLHLSIADLLLAAAFLFQDYFFHMDVVSDDAFSLQSWLLIQFCMSFGSSASMMWSCCFAHCMYFIVNEGNQDDLHLLRKRYSKISYFVATIRAIVCSANHYVQKTISDQSFANLNSLVVFTQATICFILCLNYYIRGFRLIIRHGLSVPWVLLAYPAILLICHTPRTFMAISKNDLLRLLGTSIWVLQGLLNALAYGLTNGIREAVKEQCFPENEDIQESDEGTYFEDFKEDGASKRLVFARRSYQTW